MHLTRKYDRQVKSTILSIYREKNIFPVNFKIQKHVNLKIVTYNNLHRSPSYLP